MTLKDEDKQQLDRLFLKSLMHRGAPEVTDEELAYFRERPEQIDKISAPVNIHKWFLIVGTLLGAAFVAASKMLKFSELFVVRSEATREFLVDIVFETGVALIGAAATAYVLGILLDRQQENASKWRAEIRKRLKGGG